MGVEEWKAGFYILSRNVLVLGQTEVLAVSVME
jgi:hypothetical protein